MMRILAILLAYVLTDQGYEVICTHSTDEALHLAKTEQFDLYMVDNWMPGASGTELTRKLREFDIRTPVLFYSAAAFASDKEDALISGAQGYLVKPVANEELIAEVGRLISQTKVAIPLKVEVSWRGE